ncbi:MAG: carboxypeptidase-like regulatory domain-containing protein [Flavobacteriales bacterium]|nr:carboxypeptidase-like regulatory domain-containing protein [Flavobacteriales bacterium]
MKTKYALFNLVVLTLALFASFSQTMGQSVQTVIGQVFDADSKEPLEGVTVTIEVAGNVTGTITDESGYFELNNIPIGRHNVKFEFVGYQPSTISNVIVTSGKQSALRVVLSEAENVLLEAVVRAKDKASSNNDLVTVSSRSFDAEEAERYPGSRQDPARMAQNFAGVQGTDDQRNDIVVRGNSPLGLLWRFEGIDIFNPNHFAIAGTTGGPISMINNKVIGNSDFLTGAFPAEYGNGVAGVFDLSMRNGNYNKPEYSAQFGLFGTELLAEGPINKEKRSSYLVNYRYATFGIFQALGISLGTDANPIYQDASFKLNFPNKKGGFSLFGLGGMSSIDIVFSDDEAPTEELYGLKDRDQYFRTSMGLLGATYRRHLKGDASWYTTVAFNAQEVRSKHNKIFRDPEEYTNVSLLPVLRMNFTQSKTSVHSFLNKKFNWRSSIKTGLMADLYNINFLDSTRNERTFQWVEQVNATDHPAMLRGYINWKYKLSSTVTMQSGLHAIYTQFGDEFSLEPRIGFTWKRTPMERWAFAYGNHSQAQPTYVYYAQFVDSISKTFGMHNRNMGLTKSHHFVLSYERTNSRNMRIRSEWYFQNLYNVPVEARGTSFSLLNQGSGFVRFFPDVLENTGTGINYGTEITVEKFFSNRFFYLFTASLFDSEYTGSDGEQRETDFNGNYIVNALLGYELPLGEGGKNSLILGTKFTRGGGRRYSPIDTAATIADGANVIFSNELRNTLQFKDYMRWDLKFGYKINGKKATHEISLDLVNVLNIQNVLTISYFDDPENPGNKIFAEECQLGFLPVFYYKIDF